MREDSRDYPGAGHMHWHDGGTCHGYPTADECATNAVASGWTGKVLEREDAYASGEKVKCYSLIAGSFDHHSRFGAYVVEIKLVAAPLVNAQQPTPPGRVNRHGAYICGPCSNGEHLGTHHNGSQHALCQCSCDGVHDARGRIRGAR